MVVEPEGETLGLLPISTVILMGDPPRERQLEGIRPHAGRLLVRIAGVEDRDAAETLRGCWLRVHPEELPAAGQDSAYVDDLVGCRLETEDGEMVGTVRGVVPAFGRDLLEVRTQTGEILVPMVRAWLVELDPAARRIRMRLPAGLTAD